MEGCFFLVTGEHNVLRQKISEEKAEEMQQETLLEQQRCEEERLLQEELVKQQQLAKGKSLIKNLHSFIVCVYCVVCLMLACFILHIMVDCKPCSKWLCVWVHM